MTLPEKIFLSYPTDLPVSPYARVAQATNLLGKVIRHCEDFGSEPEFTRDRMVLLNQTTSSLLDLLQFDSNSADSCHDAAALCFR